jgi:hypothetical protein
MCPFSRAIGEATRFFSGIPDSTGGRLQANDNHSLPRNPQTIRFCLKLPNSMRTKQSKH